MENEIKSVVVAGAGTMGAGIAQAFAQAQFETVLVDLSEQQLNGALNKITSSLKKLAQKGKIAEGEIETIVGRIRVSTELKEQPDADLFIEAIPEQLSLKTEMFQIADAIFKPHTVFASNTSGLSITRLASATSRPQKVIGLHFFNPVPLMKLLEIVVGESTSKESLHVAMWISKQLAKEAIVVRDSPGFATSRLGIAMAFEAIRMLEDKVASAEDIDKAMTLGYGHPMGPLRLTDLVGLDVRLAIGENLRHSLGQTQFEPPALLREMVKEGKLGQKTGRGFYLWDISVS